MNFQQLRIVREAARRQFNLTEVGAALFTSQSGVSKHIMELERELGVDLFERKGKRLLGLTAPGKDLLKLAERMLVDADNVRRLADHYRQRDAGELRIATTHTQARYLLPGIVQRFKARYPNVHLALHQGSPREIVDMLLAGETDIGIATEALDGVPELHTTPCYTWHHALIAPRNHPLVRPKIITLEAIAEHPIITYHAGFTGRAQIDATFAAKGLQPDVVLSAIDADVIKTYVEVGLGVGIIAPIAFDAVKDSALVLRPCPHLFPANTTRLAVRRGAILRDFARTFVSMVGPESQQ